jgi:AraC family transcriptional regulator, regulatory protein of adaptative response / methylated-DNA-[protein]-cysteine methyltransferase
MLHDHIEQIGQVGQVGRVGQVGMRTVDDSLWSAVIGHESSMDGRFVYAVTSTGVYCRPSCPSRRPRRENVRFFDTPRAAETAGFRACRRCRPDSDQNRSHMTDAIARASAYLAAHADQPVTLTELARLAGLSPAHFQREFKRALGVSPREYHAACRARKFRGELRAGRDVSAALYEAGYGSPSRIYEAPPTGRGMGPGAYRRGGAGMEVAFATVECALGWLLVATTTKGVCAVKLGDSPAALEADLRRELPAANINSSRPVQPEWIKQIVDRVSGSARGNNLPMDVRGTAFQWRVWRALQDIPTGETRSYADVARSIGRPTAVRAVARACASNPVCLVVPCHRVVAKSGAIGGYRWGQARKARLLAVEQGAPVGARRGSTKAK